MAAARQKKRGCSAWHNTGGVMLHLCGGAYHRCQLIKSGAGIAIRRKTMKNIDFAVKDALIAMQEGRMGEALRYLEALWDEANHGRARAEASEFMIMFAWQQLAEKYLPARDALSVARDEQVSSLLTGDELFSNGRNGPRRSRFDIIEDMNQTLNDPGATCGVFRQLDKLFPAFARRAAYCALPAIVEVGDFTLAERYMADPRDLRTHAADLNRMAGDFPLFPLAMPGSPRLAAELAIFIRAVRVRAAVLHGLGRTIEAEDLRDQALEGLESEPMRALALRELAVPGTIFSEISDHRMLLEAARDSAEAPDTPHP